MALQARLRAPGGCPWDREQTHQSLRPFLVEETYEALDAMESGSAGKFASELGDLLLQIIFHARLAEEAERFSIADVIRAVRTKMVRRHPHVFGNAKARTAAQVLKNWERTKAGERRAEPGAGKGKGGSLLDGVPRSLPALLEAFQFTRRASNVGFDWDDAQGVIEKLAEEAGELRDALSREGPARMASAKKAGKAVGRPAVEEEVGDVLFSAVNLARFLGVDPEMALKKASRKFAARFRWMEENLAAEGLWLSDAPRERMEELWNLSKKQG